MTDLFTEAAAQDQLTEAKEAISDMPQRHDGTRLGCISLVKRKLDISYCEAAEVLRALVAQGWITESDDEGRRRIL